jgi:hypothetical protein
MDNKRLKVGFLSNSPLIKTGLSRNVKAVLPILYKKNKNFNHLKFLLLLFIKK